ncbi:hypothetical protein RvY_07201 [Ramazzottius varieornatus]|uniref:Uncharacterized protein n=1 Tax=Ramazzottius varieornatus TaxID=947166 RepID=A0A1D1V1I7_RAMVA|nr:hypothetical protein RvY_07201 [Ramazzottius varieornatus]
MMQEVGNDSNGESTFDFVADATKNTPPPPPSSSPPKLASSTPIYAAPPGAITLSGQKPSYAFPGSTLDIPNKSVSSSHPPSTLPPSLPPRFQSPLQPHQQELSSSSTGNTHNTPADLTEIFGSELISKLPPLQSSAQLTQPLQPVPLAPRASINPSSFAASTSPTNSSLPPSYSNPPKVAPWNDPPPLTSGTSLTGSVNPYSSQAAAGHLPSFSGFRPLSTDGVRPPMPSSLGGFPSAQVTHPVSIMPINAVSVADVSGSQFGGGVPVRPSVSNSSVGSEGSYSVIDTRIPPVYGQTVPNAPVDYNTPSSSSNQSYSMPPVYQQPQHYGGGGGGENHGNKSMVSWWTSTTLDTLKTVTEKAKSTAYGLINTLDPQMKQFSSAAGSEGSPAGAAGGELTLFYIGNELNIMDAISSGVEFSYRSTHIYSRSGAAPGHKQQIGFANALTVATSTLQLAQSNPQLQSTPLLAVEPFVVELMPETWYACTCVVLSDPSKGALLHCFSQSVPLPAGVINQPGDQQLSMPLDELLARQLSLSNRDTWSEQIGGVSWNATIAFAVRQLFASHRKFS